MSNQTGPGPYRERYGQPGQAPADLPLGGGELSRRQVHRLPEAEVARVAGVHRGGELIPGRIDLDGLDDGAGRGQRLRQRLGPRPQADRGPGHRREHADTDEQREHGHAASRTHRLPHARSLSTPGLRGPAPPANRRVSGMNSFDRTNRGYRIRRPDQPAAGKSSTCFLVMLSRIPASTPVTALIGMLTSLRPQRCPSWSSTWVTRLSSGSTRKPCTFPISPSSAWTLSPRCTSTSPSGTTSWTTTGVLCPTPMPIPIPVAPMPPIPP